MSAEKLLEIFFEAGHNMFDMLVGGLQFGYSMKKGIQFLSVPKRRPESSSAFPVVSHDEVRQPMR